MSQRGPKPKLKSVVPLAQEWEAPTHLKGLARSEFDHTVDLLRQRGSLGSTDRTLVIRRAELCQVAHDAYRALQGGELFALSDRANLNPHPGVKVHLQASLAIKAIDSELGITPASARPSTGQKSNDPYSSWRAKLGGV
jgi:P27 family predicted phage terminase small subunit